MACEIIDMDNGLYAIKDGPRLAYTCPCCQKPLTLRAAAVLLIALDEGNISADDLFKGSLSS